MMINIIFKEIKAYVECILVKLSYWMYYQHIFIYDTTKNEVKVFVLHHFFRLLYPRNSNVEWRIFVIFWKMKVYAIFNILKTIYNRNNEILPIDKYLSHVSLTFLILKYLKYWIFFFCTYSCKMFDKRLSWMSGSNQHFFLIISNVCLKNILKRLSSHRQLMKKLFMYL